MELPEIIKQIIHSSKKSLTLNPVDPWKKVMLEIWDHLEDSKHNPQADYYYNDVWYKKFF